MISVASFRNAGRISSIAQAASARPILKGLHHEYRFLTQAP
jgi:hypothetical protein